MGGERTSPSGGGGSERNSPTGNVLNLLQHGGQLTPQQLQMAQQLLQQQIEQANKAGPHVVAAGPQMNSAIPQTSYHKGQQQAQHAQHQQPGVGFLRVGSSP